MCIFASAYFLLRLFFNREQGKPLQKPLIGLVAFSTLGFCCLRLDLNDKLHPYVEYPFLHEKTFRCNGMPSIPLGGKEVYTIFIRNWWFWYFCPYQQGNVLDLNCYEALVDSLGQMEGLNKKTRVAVERAKIWREKEICMRGDEKAED